MANISVRPGNSGEAVLPYLQIGQTDPTVVPTPGSPGMLYLLIPINGTPDMPAGLYQKILTEASDTNWEKLSAGAGGGVTTVGGFDTQPKDVNAAVISGPNIFFQSSDVTHPGMLSLFAQTLVGIKTLFDPLRFPNQSVLPVTPLGHVDVYSESDALPGDPGYLKYKDQNAAVRYVNGLVNKDAVLVTKAPQFLNFVGTNISVVPNGLGADISVAATAPFARESFVLAAAQPTVVLAATVQHDSVVANLQGSGLLMEGAGNDYTLDDLLNPGFTTIVFDAALVPSILVGQKFQVQYSV